MPHSPDDRQQLLLYQKITKYLLDFYGLNYQDFYEQLNYHHLLADVAQKTGDEPKDE